MNVIREYKLYKLGIPIRKEWLGIFQFFEQQLEKLEISEPPHDSSWVFYINKHTEAHLIEYKRIVEYNTKEKHIGISHKFLQKMFHRFILDDDTSKKLIVHIMTKNYGIEVEKISVSNLSYFDK